MGFVRSLANSAVKTATVFGFFYLAYEINRSLFLTGIDLIKTNFSDDETENEDSETEESETEE